MPGFEEDDTKSLRELRRLGSTNRVAPDSDNRAAAVSPMMYFDSESRKRRRSGEAEGFVDASLGLVALQPRHRLLEHRELRRRPATAPSPALDRVATARRLHPRYAAPPRR